MQLETNLREYKDRLSKDWVELPPWFIASSRTSKGKEEILQFIEDTNQLFSS